MKKLFFFFLLWFLVLVYAAFGQQKPVYEATRTDQVLSHRALQATQFFAPPKGANLSFPSYVPDTVKAGSLRYKTGINSGMYYFDSILQRWVKLIPENTYYLSQNGVYSDANIMTGSTYYGTDATLSIQKILDNAASGQTINVIVDVKCSAYSLKYYSNTRIIILPNCGIIARPLTNAPLLRNANKSPSGAILDSNIVVAGGVINFNGSNQLHDTPTEGFITGIKAVGVKNMRVEGCQLLNTKTFTLLSHNFDTFFLKDCIIDVGPNAQINADGGHWNGPGKNLWVENCLIRSYDDGIAIAPNDVVATYEPGGYVGGDISNVTIRNITFLNSLFGVALRSSYHRLDNVLIDGLFGTTKGYGIVADNYWQLQTLSPSGKGNFGSITIRNYKLNVVSKGVTFNIKQSFINLLGKFDHVLIDGIDRRYFSYDAPIVRADSSYTDIKKLEITAVASVDTSTNNYAAPVIGLYSGATVDHLIVSHVYAVKPTDKDAPVILVAGGNVGVIQANDWYTKNLLNGIKFTSGSIGSIFGVNIVHKNSTPSAGWLRNDLLIPFVKVKNHQTAKLKSGVGAVASFGADSLFNNSVTSFGIITEQVSVNSTGLGFNRKVDDGQIYDNTGYAYQWQHTVKSTTAANDKYELQIYKNDGSASASHAITFQGDGKIGINNVNPQQQWDVGGNINVSGMYAIGNATALSASGATLLLGGGTPFTAILTQKPLSLTGKTTFAPGTSSSAMFGFPTGVAKTTPVAGDGYFDGLRLYLAGGSTYSAVAYTSDLANTSNFYASGSSSSSVVVIPHGLNNINSGSKVLVTALSVAAAGFNYVSIDATNVTIYYPTNRPDGVNNLYYTISIKP